MSGLTIGNHYQLSFDTAGSFIVPTDPFTVSILGGAPSAAFTPGTSYTTHVIDFTATATSGTISFGGSLLSGNYATAIDNLVLSSAPEPATWGMMLTGFGLTGAVMRRRKAHPLAA